MAYDPITRTISIDSDSSFIADTGVYLVSTYRNIAKSNDATPDIRHDCEIIEKWIGCSGRDMNNEELDRIRKAWYGYYAVGVAPSQALQPSLNKHGQPCLL
ncbi:MAG: hypothetical protein WCE58_00365 [Gallionella sp.]